MALSYSEVLTRPAPTLRTQRYYRSSVDVKDEIAIARKDNEVKRGIAEEDIKLIAKRMVEDMEWALRAGRQKWETYYNARESIARINARTRASQVQLRDIWRQGHRGTSTSRPTTELPTGENDRNQSPETAATWRTVSPITEFSSCSSEDDEIIPYFLPPVSRW